MSNPVIFLVCVTTFGGWQSTQLQTEARVHEHLAETLGRATYPHRPRPQQRWCLRRPCTRLQGLQGAGWVSMLLLELLRNAV